MRGRVVPATALVCLVGGLLYLDARAGAAAPGLLAIVLVLGLLGCRELVALLRARGLRTQPVLPYLGVAAVVGSNWLVPLCPVESEMAREVGRLGWPLLGLAATVAASFLFEAARFRGPGGAVEAIATTAFVVCYLGVLLSFGVQLRWEGSPPASSVGIWRVVLLVASVKLGDVAAYAVGSTWGRHRLAPILSPKKTLEGALGGLAGSVGAAVVVHVMVRYVVGVAWMTALQALWFGLAIGPAAQLGDLIESLIKRDCERKDSDHVLGGMGGTLDLVDSILLASPVAYVFWLLV